MSSPTGFIELSGYISALDIAVVAPTAGHAILDTLADNLWFHHILRLFLRLGQLAILLILIVVGNSWSLCLVAHELLLTFKH